MTTTTTPCYRAGSISDKMLEILELEPERYWTLDQVIADLQWRYSGITEAGIRRSYHRMVSNGHVATRTEMYEKWWGDRVSYRERTLIRYPK